MLVIKSLKTSDPGALGVVSVEADGVVVLVLVVVEGVPPPAGAAGVVGGIRPGGSVPRPRLQKLQ